MAAAINAMPARRASAPRLRMSDMSGRSIDGIGRFGR
jgi:hypothetical protein